jgi:orotidine-5'-phosphate decarboxylase
MPGRNFRELLEARWKKGLFLCVGLDTDLEKVPDALRPEGTREKVIAFNRAIIDATADLVCAFKLNSAFYEAYGDEGFAALRDTILYIQSAAPEVPVILDSKRADIANTNERYARSAFEYMRADAITVNPYLGNDALQPFLAHKDKGIIVLCHNSNPGSGEIQELEVAGEPLYKVVARLIATKWNTNGNAAVLVGATFPDELAEVRRIVGDVPILLAGIGAQNAVLEKCVEAGKDSRGQGLIINASRSILYASDRPDFAEAARAKAIEYDGAIRDALEGAETD